MNANSIQKRPLLVVGTALGLASIIVGCMNGKPKLDEVSNNTAFSRDFHVRAFTEIREGDTVLKVLDAVGLPFSVTVNPVGVITTNYPYQIESPARSKVEELVADPRVRCVLQYSQPLNVNLKKYWDAEVTLWSNHVADVRFELYWE